MLQIGLFFQGRDHRHETSGGYFSDELVRLLLKYLLYASVGERSACCLLIFENVLAEVGKVAVVLFSTVMTLIGFFLFVTAFFTSPFGGDLSG